MEREKSCSSLQNYKKHEYVKLQNYKMCEYDKTLFFITEL
jgi:hypothetical protein